MYTLTNIRPMQDFKLVCNFDNGIVKVASLESFLNAEAFQPLQNIDAFMQVVNKKYFVEWPKHDVDLSADTLWHIASEVQPSLFQ